MRTVRQRLGTVLCASTILLIGALVMPMAAFAEEASSGAHGGDSKGSSAPAEASGDKAPSKGGGGEGAKGESHPSHGDGGKNQQGGSVEHGGQAKDAGPSVQTGKDSSNVDVPAEPSRRLDKKNKPGENNAIQSKQGPNRRLSPAPQAPNPVRNAIGVVVPPPVRVEPHEGAHPPPAAPHPPSATTPVVPNAAAPRLAKPDVTSHATPNPAISPTVVNRGAINGTSVTHHNVGPPRIGGPTASAAGINGTTIRAKH
jgi:hypothetical protein